MTPTSGERVYPRLFSPFRLGPLALPNRFVVPGLTTSYASADGFVTDALCTYLAARADDDAAWETPRPPCATRGWLDDAYEPGRMTRTVYDAVAQAMLLDGS